VSVRGIDQVSPGEPNQPFINVRRSVGLNLDSVAIRNETSSIFHERTIDTPDPTGLFESQLGARHASMQAIVADPEAERALRALLIPAGLLSKRRLA